MQTKSTSWLFRGLTIFSAIAVLGIPRVYRFMEVNVPNVLSRSSMWIDLLFVGMFTSLLLLYRDTARKKFTFMLMAVILQFVYVMCDLKGDTLPAEVYLICMGAGGILCLLVSAMWYVPNDPYAVRTNILLLFGHVPIALYVYLQWDKDAILNNTLDVTSLLVLIVLAFMYSKAKTLDRKIGDLIGEDIFVEDGPWGPWYRRKSELASE